MKKVDLDWRLNTYSFLGENWISPWTNQLVEKGTQVTVVACALNKYGSEFSVPVPNATAMMLNSSQRAYREAAVLRRKNKIDEKHSQKSAFKSNKEAIDYLELVIESVITAHIALEAFANEIIPEDFTHTRVKKSGEETLLNKEHIQRHISLCEKISELIPVVLNIASPKGNKDWQSYQKLKRLRDRITHMKSEDRKSAGSDVDSIWRALLYAEAPHLQALSIINYFSSGLKEKPGWLTSGTL